MMSLYREADRSNNVPIYRGWQNKQDYILGLTDIITRISTGAGQKGSNSCVFNSTFHIVKRGNDSKIVVPKPLADFDV